MELHIDLILAIFYLCIFNFQCKYNFKLPHLLQERNIYNYESVCLLGVLTVTIAL